MDYGQTVKVLAKAMQTHQHVLEAISARIENELPSYTGNITCEEERFQIQQLKLINHHYFEGFVATMNYLTRPIRLQGYLQKQANERYALKDWELSSGSPVELYIYDEDEGCHNWQVTRIEHADKFGGYYAYHYPELDLEGVKARIR